jgi:hypothetical protein
MSQVFLYLDPYIGLSACIHVSSPVCKVRMTLTILCPPGSHDSIKADNVFENAFNMLIKYVWLTSCLFQGPAPMEGNG